MVGLEPTFAADTAAMCHGAVMALYFGRTPRGGTAGHVASRRGLDPDDTVRRPLRGPRRDRGQPGDGPAEEPAWTVARREEAEARAEHPCHAGKRPGTRGRRVAPKPGSRPLPATARRSRRVGTASAKCVEGQLAACLRIRRALRWQGERIAHHNLAPHASPGPPRGPGRGRSSLSRSLPDFAAATSLAWCAMRPACMSASRFGPLPAPMESRSLWCAPSASRWPKAASATGLPGSGRTDAPAATLRDGTDGSRVRKAGPLAAGAGKVAGNGTGSSAMRPYDVVEVTATATFPAVSVGGCAAVKGLLRRPGRSGAGGVRGASARTGAGGGAGVRERPGRP